MLVTTVVAYASNIPSGLFRFHDDIVLRYWGAPETRIMRLVTMSNSAFRLRKNMVFEVLAYPRDTYRDS